ncbi:hypothetical protein N8904_00330 [Flavobacteriales bacterium]|nr:hypothetical protein [Flavobacteriales bacterium]
MKKVLIVLSAGFLFSCTNSDDCHECHIAWENAQGQEIEVELGEFCGAELSDLESNGDTLLEPVVVGMDTVPAAYYPGSSIHCEEHADH